MKTAGELEFDEEVKRVKAIILWGSRFGFAGGLFAGVGLWHALAGQWVGGGIGIVAGIGIYSVPYVWYLFGVGIIRETTKQAIRKGGA